MCRDLPDALDEALQLLNLDRQRLEDHLDDAHAALHDDHHDDHYDNDDHHDRRSDSTGISRLELTFRVYSPVYDENVARYCQMQTGTWMQYACDLTGMWVAVREGAPIPVVVLYGTTTEGDEALLECYKIHPDYLQDRKRLYRAIVEQLESGVRSGVRQAYRAFDSLRFLTGLDDLPGRPAEGACYPAGRGYEPLGDRPLPADNLPADD